MSEAVAQRLRPRTAVAAFAAYVLLLHSLVVGAAILPAADAPGLAAFLHICHSAAGLGDTRPVTPDLPRHDHPDCALCGHCGIALPAGMAEPGHSLGIAAEAAFTAAEAPALPARPVAAQPRGPPAQA